MGNRCGCRLQLRCQSTFTAWIGATVFFFLFVVIWVIYGYEPCEINEFRRVYPVTSPTVSLSLNRSANPCHDFYEFTCGNWPKANPGHTSETSRSTVVLIEEAGRRLVLHPIQDSENQTAIAKAANLYVGCIQGDDQIAKLRHELLPEMNVRWPNAKGDVDPVQHLVDLGVQWQMPTLLDVRTDDYVQLSQQRSPVFDTVTMDWWQPVFRRLHERGEYGNYVRAYYEVLSDDRNETSFAANKAKTTTEIRVPLTLAEEQELVALSRSAQRIGNLQAIS